MAEGVGVRRARIASRQMFYHLTLRLGATYVKPGAYEVYLLRTWYERSITSA